MEGNQTKKYKQKNLLLKKNLAISFLAADNLLARDQCISPGRDKM